MSERIAGNWIEATLGHLPEYLSGGALGELPTAGGFELGEPRSGAAWSDPHWMECLRQRHARMGAPERSMANLEALGRGAACVVTGQQPGLGGGPLYTWWKVAGAVIAARWASERLRHPVVPVFWCGTDDSDFDEARRAYHARPGQAPARMELPGDLWRAGQMVGTVDAARVERFELERELVGDALASEAADWGESFAARLLRDFAESGVVVVDPRDERLVERGQDLFEEARRDWPNLRAAVAARAEELAARGWPRALSARSLDTPLYRLEEDLRIPLADIEGAGSGRVVPSVVLRALWQDRELAPLLTILGPSELAYQAQLTPLYDRLGVAPPGTIPRPHLGVLADADDVAWSPEELAALSASESVARSLLAERALPASDRAVCERLTHIVNEARREVGSARARSVDHFFARQQRELKRLRRALAWERRPEVESALGWLWPRGRPQERGLSTSCLRAAGLSGDAVVACIDGPYRQALDEQRLSTGWWQPFSDEGSAK